MRHLDNQLINARHATEAPQLSNHVWSCLATTIYDEDLSGLDEATVNDLRLSMLIPPQRYVEELTAFQAWMDLAHAKANSSVVVRAQVMTELYVAFVWLRDSIMKPTAAALSDRTAFATVEKFLRTGRRRTLRNATAHGRWCYLPDFSGLECWAEPTRGQPHQRFEILHTDLDAWQLLSRGAAIATLLALANSVCDP